MNLCSNRRAHLGFAPAVGAFKETGSFAWVLGRLTRILSLSSCTPSTFFLLRFLLLSFGVASAKIADGCEDSGCIAPFPFFPVPALLSFSGGRGGVREHFVLLNRQHRHALLAGPTHSVRFLVQVMHAGLFVKSGPL